MPAQSEGWPPDAEDPSYREHVRAALRVCRCCAGCGWSVPCDGTLAGGMCDEMCWCQGCDGLDDQ